LVLASCLVFGLSLTFPFCLPYDGSGHRFLIILFLLLRGVSSKFSKWKMLGVSYNELNG
jgi:hypothetical protein